MKRINSIYIFLEQDKKMYNTTENISPQLFYNHYSCSLEDSVMCLKPSTYFCLQFSLCLVDNNITFVKIMKNSAEVIPSSTAVRTPKCMYCILYSQHFTYVHHQLL